MSILDTVDPDGWMHDQRKDTVPNAAKQLWLKVRAKQVEHYTKPLYSRETVESLLAEHRKQVLMEAAEYFDNGGHQKMITDCDLPAEILRHMAESTKGEK